MKRTLTIGFLLYASAAVAQVPVCLSEKVVEIMATELNYAYDSTSNRRERASGYQTDTTRRGIHDRFPITHNPSPLVIVDGIRTSVETLDSTNVTVVIDTIQILPADDSHAAALYGTRGAKRGVILVTTKKQ